MTKFDDRQEEEEDMDPLGIHKSAWRWNESINTHSL